MDNKKTLLKVNDLSRNLKEIKTKLFKDESINFKDILKITDKLDVIDKTSNKILSSTNSIFMKEGALSINDNLKGLFSKIEEVENKRLLEDEKILSKIHEISYKQDYLELNFTHLIPSDIDVILSILDNEIEDILALKPYNEKVILPLIKNLKDKLIDLHFRYDFPIVDELDEDKNSYAHRLYLLTEEIKATHPKTADLLIKNLDDLIDLVWISKMFIYKDKNKAKKYFERLDDKIKNKVRSLIWQAKGSSKKDLSQDLYFPYALMNFVESEINA